jgi:hypothetical protein
MGITPIRKIKCSQPPKPNQLLDDFKIEFKVKPLNF